MDLVQIRLLLCCEILFCNYCFFSVFCSPVLPSFGCFNINGFSLKPFDGFNKKNGVCYGCGVNHPLSVEVVNWTPVIQGLNEP